MVARRLAAGALQITMRVSRPSATLALLEVDGEPPREVVVPEDATWEDDALYAAIAAAWMSSNGVADATAFEDRVEFTPRALPSSDASSVLW